MLDLVVIVVLITITVALILIELFVNPLRNRHLLTFIPVGLRDDSLRDRSERACLMFVEERIGGISSRRRRTARRVWSSQSGEDHLSRTL